MWDNGENFSIFYEKLGSDLAQDEALARDLALTETFLKDPTVNYPPPGVAAEVGACEQQA